MFRGSAAQNMNFISPNSPAYYLTSVAKDRLPVFRLDILKSVACSALSEARESGGFVILAYVIMPDHFHVITDGEKKPSVIQRFINGITSRRRQRWKTFGCFSGIGHFDLGPIQRILCVPSARSASLR